MIETKEGTRRSDCLSQGLQLGFPTHGMSHSIV